MVSALVFFFLIAIIISFLCSLWEAVFLSITPSYAQVKLKEGSPVGSRLQDFKEHIDRPLAAILSLNTIAHTVGAVGVGNQATKIWADANPLITGVLVPVVMTLAILVLSELIPKTIGANFWRELAPFTVKSLALIIKVLYPLVWFSQFITSKLKKDKTKSIFTRNDFLAMAEIGTEQGVIDKEESEFIASLFRFKSIRTMDIMTPRIMIKAVSRDVTIKQFHEETRDAGFSRILLFKGQSKDNFTGYVLKDEVLGELAEDKGDNPVSGLERRIISVAENYPITELLKQFLNKREHIAVVVDDFGGVEGIVSMEDVIETLLGLEIVDEMDKVEDLQKLARKRWEKRAGSASILKHLDDLPPHENTETDK